MISDEAKGRLRRLMEARVARDEAKATLKRLEEEYRESEAGIYEELEDMPGTLSVDLGEPWGVVKFRNRETYYAKIIDQDKALEHYEARARIDEVSAPKFVMARLNEDVRDALEQGQSPPPGVDYYANRGVTITRQKD